MELESRYEYTHCTGRDTEAPENQRDCREQQAQEA